MDKFSRKHQLLMWLKNSRSYVSKQELMQRFERNERTIKRDIEDLRADGYHIFNKVGVGYKLNTTVGMEVPGIWFSPEELYALFMVQQLSSELSGGVFDVQPVQNKIQQLLGHSHPNVEEMHRIHVLSTGSRCKKMPLFGLVAQALLSRHRVQILYHGREKNKQTKREVSPQRIVFYRGNWYLDAWCHKAKGLRSFAIEKIIQAEGEAKPCKHVLDSILDEYFIRSFGIYSGQPTQIAILHFTTRAAQWVVDEEWFPDIEGSYLDNGKFALEIPYNNATELIMEICRYGDQVEVIGPSELREQVAAKLCLAAEQYR